MNDNLGIQSLKSRYVLKDHMMVDMYIPDTIDIDSGVFLSCKTSRNTYEAAFEEKN